MRGLIYKNVTVFYRSIDKRSVLIAAAAIVLLMINTGIYAGLLASLMLAITVGMQNIMSFASDEKARWKSYELTMPVSGFLVVASKYVSVMCTLLFSVAGSVLFNTLSSILTRRFVPIVWILSIASAVIIPLLWTEICLPFSYWLGFHSAQTMGLLVMVPMFYLVKYFEDGLGVSVSILTGDLYSYVLMALIVLLAVMLLFIISMLISTAGYRNRK